MRSSYARVDILRSIPCSLRFLSIEPLMESVTDIDLTGIGWVAAGGMSGVLHKTHQMRMDWAAEVHNLWQGAEHPIPLQAGEQHPHRAWHQCPQPLSGKARRPGCRSGYGAANPGVPRDEKIVAWIAKARKQYAAGDLQPYQIRRLEKVPGWSWTEEAFHG